MKSLFDTPLRYKLAFAFILIAALFFRTANLSDYFFFSDYDEYFTVKTVTGIYEDKLEDGQCIKPKDLVAHDAQQLLHDSMRDFGNNTLYNFILGTYIHTVGFSDLNLRLFSVFFGILSIVLIHPIGREIQAKNHHILMGMMLLAFNPILMHYSDIIRAYSWCVFLTLLFYLYHLKALRHPQVIKNWFMIGLLGLAMFLSHYLMIYVVGTSFLFLVFQFRKNLFKQYSLLLSYGIMGCFALLFMVSNPQFVESVSNKNESLQKQASLSDDTQKSRKIDELSLASFASGAVSYLNQYYCYSYFPLGLARRIAGNTGLWLLGLILLILPGILIYAIARNSPPPAIALALWMGVAANVMVFVLVLLSKHDTSFSIKYTIFSLPLYLIAIAFQQVRNRWFTWAFTATAIIAFSSCVNAVIHNYQKPIALEVDGKKHEILPENRRELLALSPIPHSNNSSCTTVYSKQEVIFLALSNSDWMSENLCIADDSLLSATCDTVNIRFQLTH